MGEKLKTLTKTAEVPKTVETHVESAPITTDSVPETPQTTAENPEATHGMPTDTAPVESAPTTLEDVNVGGHPTDFSQNEEANPILWLTEAKLINVVAAVCYNTYAAHCRTFDSDYTKPKWEDLPDGLREAAIQKAHDLFISWKEGTIHEHFEDTSIEDYLYRGVVAAYYYFNEE